MVADRVPLPPRVRRGYGLGSVATGAFGTVPGLLLLPYLTDRLGIAAGLAGLIVLLPKAWDVVLNPIAGRLSDRLDAAFHEHQGRGRALGHRAIDRLVDRHPRALRADSPWQLNAADPADAALIDRFLTERAAAAVAARPELRDPARSWLERRRADLRRGRLTVRLEHTDVWLSPQ